MKPIKKHQRCAEIKAMVRAEPGIRASEIARRFNTSPATISLVVKALREAKEIEQVRDSRGRGFGLRTNIAALRQLLVTRAWNKIYDEGS